MDEKAAITADTMELLLLNQTAIRAALEELSLWVSQRGSIHIHDNVMVALTAPTRMRRRSQQGSRA